MRFLTTLARGRTSFVRVLPLMRDARVPFALKAGAAALALLVISPLDVFGDIPVLGLLDDAVLLTILATLFVKFATWSIYNAPSGPIDSKRFLRSARKPLAT